MLKYWIQTIIHSETTLLLYEVAGWVADAGCTNLAQVLSDGEHETEAGNIIAAFDNAVSLWELK